MRICIWLLASVVRPVMSYDTHFMDVTSTDTRKGLIDDEIKIELSWKEEMDAILVGESTCAKTKLQKDYRGTISKTTTGKTCQRWDTQYPHKHTRTSKKYPGAGLVNNDCRNPDSESVGAWCYTTDPNTRWEPCDVANCRSTCADTKLQKDYRGTISKTTSGKTCQRWDTQYPHKHTRTSKKYPWAGLVDNDCRNPDSTVGGAWCYTTDPSKRWELCEVAKCELPCAKTKLQKDYRGTTSKTTSGKTCQRWDTQYPHKHTRTSKKYSWAGLVDNYCRNPDSTVGGAWCYTTDPRKRWELCDVANCGSSCGNTKLQKDYRGTISKTTSGKTCQRWDTQYPHKHSVTAKKYPGAGLVDNVCRNPNSYRGGAWCLTTDPNTRWETCDVANCGSSCANTKLQQDYRGTMSKTTSGKTCQQWDVQYPHKHTRTSKRYGRAGLVDNYCRNPDSTVGGAWCYTTDPNKRWETCEVANCFLLVEKE